MEEKIKILQLAPRYPFPMDDGGKIGIANITKELASLGAEITFFTFSSDEISEEHKKLIEPYAELISYKHSTNNTPLRIVKSIFRKESLYSSKHRTKNIISFLDELVSKKKFDVIHADHSCMAPLALGLKEKFGIPVGLRLHNIEWIIWQRYADILPKYSPKRIYIQSQANKVRELEKKILRNIDVAFPITEQDKSRALDLYNNANLKISSAGVDLIEWQPDDSIMRNPKELILATFYHWRHNVDGLKWFLDNVIPVLHKTDDGIKLTLIGKEAPQFLDNYSHLGVNLIGYVDKVQPYHNHAGIYISPLIVGGGIRIKILEAMAMKLPVIATPVAAEGINATAEDGLFICKNKEQWIEAIQELMQDSDKRTISGENARKYVIENHNWHHNIKIMFDEYRKIIKR